MCLLPPGSPATMLLPIPKDGGKVPRDTCLPSSKGIAWKLLWDTSDPLYLASTSHDYMGRKDGHSCTSPESGDPDKADGFELHP